MPKTVKAVEPTIITALYFWAIGDCKQVIRVEIPVHELKMQLQQEEMKQFHQNQMRQVVQHLVVTEAGNKYFLLKALQYL